MNLRKDHYWNLPQHSYERLKWNKLAMRDVCVHFGACVCSSVDSRLSCSQSAQLWHTFMSHSRQWFVVYHNSKFEQKIIEKILSGGSLGSYVDEGRSKMREIVWIAGHIEHRYSERKLQSEARLRSTLVWGSLLNLSTLCVCEWTSVCTKVTRSGMILNSRLCF